MKKQFMKFIAKTAKILAAVSSESTSTIFAYQPKTPQMLKKPSKKSTREVL